MGVIIYKIQQKKEDLHITALLEKKADFKLLQALFRDCISSRLCIESRFGLDNDYEEVATFKYPLNAVFDLIYQTSTGRVGLTYIPLTESKKGTSTQPANPKSI